MTQVIGQFIDGKLETGGGTRMGSVFNPSTGAEIAKCAYSDNATLDRAVDIATQAGRRWGRASHSARLAVIFKLRELMIAHSEEIAEAIGRENGKTIADARGEIGRAIEAIEFATNEPQIPIEQMERAATVLNDVGAPLLCFGHGFRGRVNAFHMLGRY